MNNQTLRDNAEINLLDVLWDVFYMWRPLVALMLVFAVITTGAMYVRTQKAAAEAIALINEQEEDPEILNKSVETARESLTDKQLATVERAVELYNHVKRMEKYNSNSIFGKLDGEHLTTLTTSAFYTEVGRDVAYNLNNYVLAIRKDLIKLVSKFYDIDEEYAYEMCGVSSDYPTRNDERYETGVIISVFVYQTRDTDVSVLKPDIEAIIKNVLKNVDYETSTDIVTKYDYDYINSQYTKKRDLAGIKVDYTGVVEGFNDEQLLVFENIVKETQNVEKPEEEEEEVVEAEIVIPQFTLQSALKYLVLGAFLGAFILCLIIFATYIFNMRIRDVDAIGRVYGLKDFGQIRNYPHKSAFKRFCFSKFVYDLRYKQKPDDALAEMKKYIDLSFAGAAPVIFSLGDVCPKALSLASTVVDLKNESRAERIKIIGSYDNPVIAMESGKVSPKLFDEIIAEFVEAGKKPAGVMITEG